MSMKESLALIKDVAKTIGLVCIIKSNTKNPRIAIKLNITLLQLKKFCTHLWST